MSKRYGHIHIAMGHIMIAVFGVFALILVMKANITAAILEDEAAVTEAAALAAFPAK